MYVIDIDTCEIRHSNLALTFVLLMWYFFTLPDVFSTRMSDFDKVRSLLEDQSRLCEVMSCFNVGLGKICSASQVPFGTIAANGVSGLSQATRTLSKVPCNSYSRNLYAVCERQGLFSSCGASLCLPVQYQCRAIDQALMLTSIRDSLLLQHIDSLYDIFLLSEGNNFLVNMTGVLVDNHFAANSAMRYAATAHRSVDDRMTASTTVVTPGARAPSGAFTSLWCKRGVTEAFQRASSYIQSKFILLAALHVVEDAPPSAQRPSDTDTLYVLSDRADPTSAVQVISGFRYEHLTNAFSTRGLESVLIKYSAPWPFNMILPDKYLSLLSLVTRRLLEISQLMALSREVWGQLSQSKNILKRTPLQPSRGDTTQRLRIIHISFGQIRQAFQAVANFTADRVRVHKRKLKRDLYLACQNGFEYFMCTLQESMRDLVDDVFVSRATLLPCPDMHDSESDQASSVDIDADVESTCEQMIVESIAALLESCRVGLFELYKCLVDTDREHDLSSLKITIAKIRARIIAIRVHGEKSNVGNGSIESLLMHLESAE